MTLRLSDVLEHFNLPVAYSFWASIMMSVLSEVEAVDGCPPTIWRKEVADAMISYLVSYEGHD